MTEHEFTYEVKQCCDRVLSDLYLNLVDKTFVENIDLVFHDESNTWVEYCGNKLGNYDRKAVDILGRVIHAVCIKHNIRFINLLSVAEMLD